MTARDASAVPPARTWLTLVPFLLAVAVAAGVGGLAAAGSQTTYRALELPPYAPPSWLFGPVWSVLYLFIGVAGWLLWRAGGWDRVMWLWTVQLLLAASVALLIAWSWHRSRVAAWLLVPYLAWVCFATALNAGIVVLN